MTTPTIQPVGSSLSGAQAAPSVSAPLTLTCRRCHDELVPSWLPRFLRHVTAGHAHYPVPFLSPSLLSASVPPTGTLSRSEDLLTPGGEAVVSGRRASANP